MYIITTYANTHAAVMPGAVHKLFITDAIAFRYISKRVLLSSSKIMRSEATWKTNTPSNESGMGNKNEKGYLDNFARWLITMHTVLPPKKNREEGMGKVELERI